MSLSLYWRRPPIELQKRGGVGLPLKQIVAQRLFYNDGSICNNAILMKDSADYHYLTGVSTCHPDPDVRRSLADLLAMVDEYGAAEVFTE